MTFCADKIKEKAGDEKLWKTLISPGIQFPEPYEPLPKNVSVLYNDKPFQLSTEITKNNPFNISEEEAAVFFAKIIDNENIAREKGRKNKNYSQDKTFRNNFWSDWKKILGRDHQIKDLDKVDFTPIVRYIAQTRDYKKDAKKRMTADEKKEEKREKLVLKEKFGYAIVDGVKRALAPWTVEPPGIFLGKNYHGRLRSRIKPGDVTINSTNNPDCFVQKPSVKNPKPEPCKWCQHVTIPTASWLACWKHTVLPTGMKYMRFVFDEKKDIDKFEKARLLNEKIDSVREKYMDDMNNRDSPTRMEGLVVYLLDKLAIRIGTTKSRKKASKSEDEEEEEDEEDDDEDEDDEKEETKDEDNDDDDETQGLTTLEKRNIEILNDNKIRIEFKGKSGVPYDNTVEIAEIAHTLLRRITKSIEPKEKLFGGIKDSDINKYLKTITGSSVITAKTFRTFHACKILEKQLEKQMNKTRLNVNSTIAEKMSVFSTANLETAILLNHKRMTDSTQQIIDAKKKLKDAEKELEKGNITEKQKESYKSTILLTQNTIKRLESDAALGTSKQNYVDPRILVAFAKKIELPIEKIYTEPQRNKFKWAMGIESKFKF
jgi:DNA topoisomerase-1